MKFTPIPKMQCLNCEFEAQQIARIDGAPAFLGCTEADPATDKFVNFGIYKCGCGLVQTDCKVDSSYEVVHSEAVGRTWQDHHEALADFIGRRDNLNILEIGPSCNPIARKLGKPAFIDYVDCFEASLIGLSPYEHYSKGKFPNVPGWLNGMYDVVIASHVFEHTDDPLGFLRRAIDCSDEVILSIPDFDHWVNDKYWNAFTAEHRIYPTIDDIYGMCDFLGVNVSHETYKNHSVFFRILCEKPYEEPSYSSRDLRVTEWFDRMNFYRNRIEDKLRVNHSPVYICGASHLSQYLLCTSNLVASQVAYCLDNSVTKNGKRLYGTKVFCKPFEYIRDFNEPLVIVGNSPYREEMTNQLLQINGGVRII